MTTQTHSSGNTMNIRLKILFHSLAFVLGISLVFISMGFGAGLLGDFIAGFQRFDLFGRSVTTADILRVIAGIFLLFIGLFMLRVIPMPFLEREFKMQFANKPTGYVGSCLLYTSPSPRDKRQSRMPSSA